MKKSLYQGIFASLLLLRCGL